MTAGRRLYLAQHAARGSNTALRSVVRPFKQRLWRKRAALVILRGLAIASLASVAGALGCLIFPISPAWWPVWSLAALAMATGLILALFQRVSYFESARVLDRNLHLKDRVSTALELESASGRPELAELQISDAMRTLRSLVPKSSIRVSRPSFDVVVIGLSTLLVTSSLVLVSAGYTLPNYAQPFRQAVLQEVQKLKYTAGMADPEDPMPTGQEADKPQTSQEMSQVFEQLQKDLKRDQSNPSQVLNDLQKAEDALKEQAAQERSTQRALDQLASALSELSTTQDASNALKSGDTPVAGQQLSQLGSKLGDMRPEAKQELAARLRQAAGQLSDQDPELAQALQQAADALQSGDDNAASEALNKLGQELSKNGNTAERAQALARALKQIEESKSKLSQASGLPDTKNPADSAAQLQGSAGDQQGQSSAGSSTGGAGDTPDTGAASSQSNSAETPNQPQQGQPAQTDAQQWSSKDAQPLAPGNGQDVKVQGDSTGQQQQGGPEVGSPITTAPGKGAGGQTGGNESGQVKTLPDLNVVPLELRQLVQQYFNSLAGGSR